MKTQILSLLLIALAAVEARAALVSFNFSGTVTSLNNPSNAVPSGIVYGTPMTGTLTYDTATVTGSGDFNSSTNLGDYYFSTNGTLSFSMHVGPHTFANVPHTNKFPYADILIHDNYFGEDSFTADEGSPYVFMDGDALPAGADKCYLNLELRDNSATAFTADSLPVTPPVLSNFPDTHRAAVVATIGNSFLFQITMTLTNITAISAQPTLKIQPQPNNTVVLSWPVSIQGFGLEQNTNLAAGIGWQTNSASVVDTATEHTVTLPAGSARFFRLVAP